jgi:predicted nucleic acid-binding protein
MPERCVDASVAIKWVLKSEVWRKNARRLLRDSAKANFTLIAPPLYEYETESVLQKQIHSGTLTIVEADAALEQLAVIGVQIATHPTMVRRAREIARQFSQPRIYDSLYAALSELRGCEFWTADRSFYNAVTKGLSFVKYLPDYQ